MPSLGMVSRGEERIRKKENRTRGISENGAG
jgi:hypothetical protein